MLENRMVIDELWDDELSNPQEQTSEHDFMINICKNSLNIRSN